MAEKDKDPNANPLTPTTTHEEVVSKETPTLYAEEVHYGYSGAKGMLKSPYVFGATLLASMGGFSYGYGMSLPITYYVYVS